MRIGKYRRKNLTTKYDNSIAADDLKGLRIFVPVDDYELISNVK